MPTITTGSAKHRGGALRGGKVKQEDYIIRIYRRDVQDPRMVVGTVEEVGEKMKKGFTDFEELRLILSVPRGRPCRRPRGQPAEETEE